MKTIVPEAHIPSHQGPDAQTVRPELDLVTIAAKTAHTQCHNHYWVVDLTRPASREEVLDVFRQVPRIAFIRMSDGIVALNKTIELMHDLGRPRGDMRKDLLTVNGTKSYSVSSIDHQPGAIPENIDAIRALSGIVRDGQESIHMTNDALVSNATSLEMKKLGANFGQTKQHERRNHLNP
jgi:glyceraldehyde-3-phosphate dehydrogenase (NAD(P))